eukprot:TRINITY_DN44740_c0_g1_i1.p1 TRINITY_DN44740_c0_g1~~TRINITY_DN44740_c0_g1_i1.p1  ORF type:complete len:880 (+),score=133.93 TRINITY_DN44740_c0_g1_i1:56-2641(+)
MMHVSAKIACVTVLATISLALEGSSWLQVIQEAGILRQSVGEFQLHFVALALGHDIDEHQKLMVEANETIHASICTLTHGKGSEILPASNISQLVASRLDIGKQLFTSLEKTAFEKAQRFSSANSSEIHGILEMVTKKTNHLAEIFDEIVSIYANTASVDQAGASAFRLSYASTQVSYAVELLKDTILIALSEDTRSHIEQTMKYFRSGHKMLTEGNVLLRVPLMTDVCQLSVMREVTHILEAFNGDITHVLDSGTGEELVASAKAFVKEKTQVADLLIETLKQAERLFVDSTQECDPIKEVSIEEWAVLINNVGKQMMLMERLVRLFANVANGVLVTKSKVDLVLNIDEANSNFNNLLFGSKEEGVPSPISPQLAVDSALAKSIWDTLEPDLRAGVLRQSIDPRLLAKCSRESARLREMLDHVMQLLVKTANEHAPSVQASILYRLEHQHMLIEEMSKDAVLVSSDIDRETNLESMKKSADAWRKSHATLLRGEVSKSNLSSDVPKITDACTLQQMQRAFDAYENLEVAAFKLAEEGSGGEDVDTLSATALTVVRKASSVYLEPGKCEVQDIFLDEMKALLFQVADLRVLSQRIQKEFLMGNSTKVNTSIAEISDSVENLIYGTETMTASPTQTIADRLFKFDEKWLHLKSALSNSTAIVTQDSLQSRSDGVEVVMTFNDVEGIVTPYVKLAQDPLFVEDLSAERVGLASQQRMLLEKMAKEALLVSESTQTTRRPQRARLVSSISLYERTHAELMDRTHLGRGTVLTKMAAVQICWNDYRQYLMLVADGSRSKNLPDMLTSLEELSVIWEELMILYAERVPAPEVIPIRSYLYLQLCVPIVLMVVPCVVGVTSRLARGV